MNSKLFIFFVILPTALCLTKELEIMASIAKLTAEGALYSYPNDYSEFRPLITLNGGDYGTYDFILIGAGTAGTILANRLSDISDWKILILETGGDESLITDVPAMAGNLQFTKEYNWGYRSTPQKYGCQGMKEKKCLVPRGKVLGGSSTINYLMYTRGNRRDYDTWAKYCPGWSYDEMLPYYIRMENSSMSENIDQNYHGRNGSLSVEHVKNYVEFSQVFLEAEKEMGKKNLDYNGKDQMGFSRLQSNTINGKRCSGNKAFLQPVSKRKNLKITKGAFVTKLLMDGKTARGVQFLKGSKKHTATATKEVILCAGAIGSPQILMHSGIGPKNDLTKLGIKSIVDLPVGKNLHDHQVILFLFATNFSDPSFKFPPSMASDYVKGFGYLTASANIQSIGYINTQNKDATYPDVEQIFAPSFAIFSGALPKLSNFDAKTNKEYAGPYGASSGLFFQALLSPKSRGSVKLKSKDVFQFPLIDLNMFEKPEDVKIMADGIENFLETFKTKAMQKYNCSCLHNPLSQCPQDFMSNEYIQCLVKHIAFSLYHLGGTCKMGPKNDPHSVVDNKLKVIGVKNLRVIDASVIPFPLTTHPNTPTYAIGLKGGDMIIEEWKKK